MKFSGIKNSKKKKKKTINGLILKDECLRTKMGEKKSWLEIIQRLFFNSLLCASSSFSHFQYHCFCCSFGFRMTDPLERYQNLALTDSLAKSYSYPLACKELSFITRGAFNKLPKNLQSLIFQHIITAFHLLPE